MAKKKEAVNEKRRQELESMTVRQLVKGPATDLQISGRWDKTKPQLIEAILAAELNGQKPATETQSADDEEKVEARDVAGVAAKEKEAAGSDESDDDDSGDTKVDENKLKYLESIEVGALVAFRASAGKVKSAMVVRKSSKNQKLKIETDYGATYVVNYSDILWVRTGKRWPRWVYNLLKGITTDGAEK